MKAEGDYAKIREKVLDSSGMAVDTFDNERL